MSSYNPTVSQKLIWLDQVMSQSSAKYNIGGYAWLEGDLVYDIFNNSLKTVLKSQEAYSTVFREINGELKCIVKDSAAAFLIEQVDVSEEEDPETSAIRWMEMDFSRPFVINDNYLFCFKLFKITPDKHFWYARIHHLIGDGWSFRLLLNQTAEFYSAGCKAEELPCQMYRYSDYAIEDLEYYHSRSAEEDRSFWLNEYKQLPAALFSRNSRSMDLGKAGAETLIVDLEMKLRLQQLAGVYNVSLFHLIIGLIIVYFKRTTGQETITMGVPVLNRTKKIYRRTAGVFMNLLALKFEIAESDTLQHVLKSIKQKMSACLRHQRYQYGNLVTDLQLPHDRKLLYDIRISYEDFDFTDDFGGLGSGAIALSNHAEIDPLAIYVREYSGKGFDIRFIYNEHYFSPERIRSISRGLHQMMAAIDGDVETPVHTIPLIDDDERKKILAAATGPARPMSDESFLEAWKLSVSRYPLQVAVSRRDKRFTYEEINEKASRLAIALSRQRNDIPSPSIALLLPRSEKMIIAMLASMMAGLPYIPIDPEYPEQRIYYMLRDSQCTMVLADASCRMVLFSSEDGTVLDIDRLLTGSADIHDKGMTGLAIPGNAPCYIMYTSGSTGYPKGVVISHRSLIDYAITFRESFQITHSDTVLQQSSISFDTSVEEIFPVLTAGGKLHILDDRRDLLDMQRTLEDIKISVLSASPWVIQFLNTVPVPSSLRLMISGGDVLKYDHVKTILEKGGIEVYNSYGPTESTVCATYFKVERQGNIPLGRPITNRKVYILDACLNLQPFEVEGDIFIGGEGLALGYLNRPSLTGERFLMNAFAPGEKIYMTGDRGALMTDGNIIFKGRKDDQVNYRGYRIETQELETIISQQDYVAGCVVDVKQVEGIPLLIAYIKYKGTTRTSAREWRRLLSRQLPAYMIPDVWMEIQEFPLLPGGKVNRKELPLVDPSDRKNGPEEKVYPGTDLELQILGIWKKLLRQNSIGIDDSFFSLGGHSLNVVQLIARMKDQFNVVIELHDIFTNDTIRGQAELIAAARPVQLQQLTGKDDQPDYPLTPAQERMWILSQLEGANIAYHIAGALCLQGNVDNEALKEVVRTIIDRHESLRTIFFENASGNVRQKILPPGKKTGDFHEFFSLEDKKGDNLDKICRSVIYRPFDLAKDLPVRTALLQVARSEYIFIYVTHHIVSDGWSMEILLREFMTLFGGKMRHNEIPLPPLHLHFKDYIDTIACYDGSQRKADEQFWFNKLKNGLPIVNIPTQYTRPAIKTYSGNEITRYFDQYQYNCLLQCCEQEAVTLFTGLFTVLNTLIARYTGQPATMIGTPIVNRPDREMQQQVGLFLNVLPIRTEFSEDIPFRELLHIQKNELLQAYQHCRYPMDELVRNLGQRNDPSRSPLFDILIVLHNQQMLEWGDTPDGGGIPGMRIRTYNDLPKETSQFDLSFSFYCEQGTIKLSLVYNTSLFGEWFARQLAEQFINLSVAAAANPEAPVSLLNFLSEEETIRLSVLPYHRYENDTPYAQPGDYLLQWAHSQPAATAVVRGDRRMDYLSLLHMAENMALYLTDVKGVRMGDTVGVMLEPDEYLPACLFAIWMAGTVYVPVSPSYPEFRQSMIIADAGCRVVMTAADMKDAAEYKAYRRHMKWVTCPTAYILYTSGTTGSPKGVVVSHQALLEKLQVECVVIAANGPVNSCLITNYSFDVSFLELLLPILTGGKILIPANPGLMQLTALSRELIKEGVNVLHGTPSFMDVFIKSLPEDALRELNDTLEVACLGGESLYEKLVIFLREQLPSVRLNNHYGPTEAVIHATVNTDIRSFERNIIGMPMPGVRTYVLDRYYNLLPPGVTGELYIGGRTAIAEGYLNKKEESIRQFLENPFVAGEKIYRTGDLVRWTGDGLLEFIGRVDEQVKIRGLRVELEEIQRTLEQFDPVRQAVVTTCRQAENMLLAAFIVSSPACDEQQLKGFLRKYLPEYMIPAILVHLTDIPLNENGKVDKEKLLACIDWSKRQIDMLAPRNNTERQLVSIWERLLDRSPVGVRDNFFDLGGNSILLVKMRSEIRSGLDIALSVKELLDLLTIEELARAIDSLQWLQQGDVGSPENENITEITV